MKRRYKIALVIMALALTTLSGCKSFHFKHKLEYYEGKPATCLESGYKDYETCKKCDYNTYEEIPPQHHYEWVVLESATMFSDGTEGQSCIWCASVGETRVIPKLENISSNIVFSQITDAEGRYLDAYEIIGVTDKKISTLFIPSEYKGLPVIEINDEAFENCTNLQYIYIPESIKEIGTQAFEDCISLEEIMIPSSTIIGYKAFEGCESLTVYKSGYDSTSVDWNPNNRPVYYGTLKNNIFYGYDNNGEYGVLRCNVFLDHAVIDDSAQFINSSAFSNCNDLISVTIPSNIGYIGLSAFSNCNKLENVNYKGTLENWCNIEFGNATSNPMSNAEHFYMLNEESVYVEVTEIEIPNTITEIGNYQFQGFGNLTSIVISDSVTSIGESAFSDCVNLKSIVVPFVGTYNNDTESSLISMFDNIPSGLIDVTVNGGIIHQNTFNSCNMIEKLTLGSNVSDIKPNSFPQCTELNSITVSQNNLLYKSIDGDVYTKDEKKLIQYAIGKDEKTYKVLDNTKIIGSYAFNGSTSIEKIIIHSEIDYIDEYAFNGCKNLKYNTYQNGYYLGNDSNLYAILVEYTNKDVKELIISDTTYCIVQGALSKLSKLESISLPYVGSSNTATGNAAMFGCIFGTSSYTGAIATEQLGVTYYIPKTLKKVIIGNCTKISYGAFSGCSNLTSITIPESVTSIGYFAFSGCSSLKSITIPKGATSIGYSAFKGCSSLESITLPFIGNTLNGTTNTHFGYIFGASSSSYNDDYVPTSLKEVIITEGTSIGESAFQDCSSLTSITIPDSVTSIGYEAFWGCSSLISITLPFIGNTINGTTNTHFGYIFGASSDLDNDDYVPRSLKEVIITCVTSIEKDAFWYCSSLTSIIIPDSVTSIRYEAFWECSSLTNVYYNGTIEDWCNIKFSGYYSNPMSYAEHFYMLNEESVYVEVTEIEIPNTITEIGNYKFYGFDNVTSIIIPESVTSIYGTFDGCSSLTNVYYNGTIEDWCNISFNSNPMDYAEHFYMLNEESIYVEVTEIEIPNTITEIGYCQFYGFDNVTSITIPESVTSIWDYAFSGCTSLTSITIPNSVTSIGSSAFQDCSSLTSITIPESVTSIGSEAFDGCSSLQYNIYDNGLYLGNEENPYLVLIKAKSTDITSCIINENTKIIYYKAFEDYTNLTSITIPEGVTSIGDDAFFGCSSLESIIIPESVTSIGWYAFSNSSLTNVYYNGTIEDWCNISFNSNPMGYAEHFYMLNEESVYVEVTEIEIPNTIAEIGNYQFYGFDNLTSITIPEDVTSIVGNAFVGCSSLTNVYYNGTIEEWCNIKFSDDDSNPMYYAEHFYMLNEESVYYEVTEIEIPNTITEIGDYQFSGFDNLTSITIPDSVTSIGECAFEDCSSLTSITIPGSVTSIGDFAFDGCSSLIYNEDDNGLYLGNEENPYLVLIKAKSTDITSYIINENTKIICYDAFGDCRNLTSITISKGVTSIGSFAFYGCSSLTSITIPEGVTSIGNHAFYNCSSLTSITIPEGVTSIGDHAFYNCSSLTSIRIPNSVTSIGDLAFWGCSSLTIYCEASSQPSGWDSGWNYGDCPVVWGYKS